ncbi:DUF2061 domain-containing protein [Marinospirillum alkaliphilum]|uniref:Uncharacterized membrane protein n=1 Tax=Marinospirillum alkaliphilum DSM 21637 TaxID=1122209 RepID=A0A1K1YZV5_9GAMM|nr:DUF2061 domain-containing protein [Marinospirillum alkaliphilum]SFX66916.1 Uncharacterized membrane protein [Marinospirillum alkaliphilum DSM 21637]
MLKTGSFAVTHFTVAFVVVWLISGDILVSSLVAMIEPAVNTVAYHFHEKIWDRIRAKKAQLLRRDGLAA